jgi:hypothetical protein
MSFSLKSSLYYAENISYCRQLRKKSITYFVTCIAKNHNTKMAGEDLPLLKSECIDAQRLAESNSLKKNTALYAYYYTFIPAEVPDLTASSNRTCPQRNVFCLRKSHVPPKLFFKNVSAFSTHQITILPLKLHFLPSHNFASMTTALLQGGSNMTGTICEQTSHSLSRSCLNHLVLAFIGHHSQVYSVLAFLCHSPVS